MAACSTRCRITARARRGVRTGLAETNQPSRAGESFGWLIHPTEAVVGSETNRMQTLIIVAVGHMVEMGILEIIRPGGKGGHDTIHECRTCGTTVDSTTSTCPECTSGGIATYRI